MNNPPTAVGGISVKMLFFTASAASGSVLAISHGHTKRGAAVTAAAVFKV